MRLPRLALVALGLTLLTAGCTNKNASPSVAGGVAATAPTATPSTEASTTSTALSAASLVLSADGLGPPLTFGTQAARALSGLTQALGHAEKVTPVPAGSTCGATRTFQWKNLVVVVNEVNGGSAAKAGIVGWHLGTAAPTALDVRTDKGIGIGSTIAALKAAYGANVSIAQGDQGPAVKIAVPNGVITGRVDGLGNANRLQSLEAGNLCGV
jgi:hypothetical protein